MFLFFWSYFSRLFSVLLFVLLFWLFLDGITILSVLLLLYRLSLLFRISLVLLLREWLPLFSVFFSFLFSNQASSLCVLALLSLLRLFQYSELELLRKKFSFLLNVSIDLYWSLLQSVSHIYLYVCLCLCTFKENW